MSEHQLGFRQNLHIGRQEMIDYIKIHIYACSYGTILLMVRILEHSGFQNVPTRSIAESNVEYIIDNMNHCSLDIISFFWDNVRYSVDPARNSPRHFNPIYL